MWKFYVTFVFGVMQLDNGGRCAEFAEDDNFKPSAKIDSEDGWRVIFDPLDYRSYPVEREELPEDDRIMKWMQPRNDLIFSDNSHWTDTEAFGRIFPRATVRRLSKFNDIPDNGYQYQYPSLLSNVQIDNFTTPEDNPEREYSSAVKIVPPPNSIPANEYYRTVPIIGLRPPMLSPNHYVPVKRHIPSPKKQRFFPFPSFQSLIDALPGFNNQRSTDHDSSYPDSDPESTSRSSYKYFPQKYPGILLPVLGETTHVFDDLSVPEGSMMEPLHHMPMRHAAPYTVHEALPARTVRTSIRLMDYSHPKQSRRPRGQRLVRGIIRL